MVTIDVPTCVLLGSAIAIRHEKDLRDRSADLRVRTLLVCALGFAPLGQLFDLYHHEWQWQYFLHPVEPAFTMLFNLAMIVGGLVGFELSRRALQAGNKTGARLIAGGAAAFTALYSAIFYQRVFWVGSYDAWSTGNATFMLSHTPFMILLASTGTYLSVSIYLWVLRPLATKH